MLRHSPGCRGRHPGVGRPAILTWLSLWTAAACAGPIAEAPTGDPPEINVALNAAQAIVEVIGVSRETTERLRAIDGAELNSVLAVYTREAARDPDGAPVLGDVRVMSNRVVFTPRFPFPPGMNYTVRFDPGAGGGVLEKSFSTPEPATTGATTVAHVYPSAETWPMNQLKMYVHFSAPMRRGRAFDHIRLIDESTGSVVEQPFVTVQEELWDAEHRTLTVLYDPARIKRGLVPNEEAGLPLLEGRSYRLVIDAELRDAAGLPLREGRERRFSVGALDRSSPHPDDWHVTPPSAGSTDPVVLSFPEPMDRGLLLTLLTVAAANGSMLSGSVEVAAQETEWRFRPSAPWQPGAYEVVVPTILEDLAGNNLKNLFDVDLRDTPSEFADKELVTLLFEVT